jgi:hypothetical protein
MTHDFSDEVPQHEAITELEEWREEAKKAVLKRNPRVRPDELSEEIDEELIDTRGPEMKARLDKMKRQKSELDARMELDEAPTQADLDAQKALADAISDYEFTLDL